MHTHCGPHCLQLLALRNGLNTIHLDVALT